VPFLDCFVADATRNDGAVIASEAVQSRTVGGISELPAMTDLKAMQDGAASIRPCRRVALATVVSVLELET
jgi:hypothetical protein